MHQFDKQQQVHKKDLHQLLAMAAEQVFKTIIVNKNICPNTQQIYDGKQLIQCHRFRKQQQQCMELCSIARRQQKHRIPISKLIKAPQIQKVFHENICNSSLKQLQQYKIRLLRNSIQQKSMILWATNSYIRLIDYNEFDRFCNSHENSRRLICYIEGLQGQCTSIGVMLMLGLISQQNLLQMLEKNQELQLFQSYDVCIEQKEKEEQDREEQQERRVKNKNTMSSVWVYYLYPHKQVQGRQSIDKTLELVIRNRQQVQQKHKIKIMSQKQYIDSQINTQKLNKTSHKLDLNPYIGHQIPESRIQQFNELTQFDNYEFFNQ